MGIPGSNPGINCTCPKVKCKRHGNCAACREHHHRMLPFCERTKRP